jgi:hypothetical protein
MRVGRASNRCLKSFLIPAKTRSDYRLFRELMENSLLALRDNTPRLWNRALGRKGCHSSSKTYTAAEFAIYQDWRRITDKLNLDGIAKLRTLACTNFAPSRSY